MKEPRRQRPGRGWGTSSTPIIRARVRYLHDYLRRPVAWPYLRHDREREVFRQGFWTGFDFGVRFAQRRQEELAAADEPTRRLYAALGGWQP